MKIRIGTRKSKLAMAQTELVVSEIKRAFPEAEIELIPISTKGDRITDRPLEAIGGSGVFVKEIEQLLLDNKIDIAVHSAKDLPVQIADGLSVSGVLERGDPCDMLVMRKDAYNSNPLKIGTGSLRRRQNFSRLYPNAAYSDIRGNVDTRLKKLNDGEYDGIILAAAGLKRINSDLSAFDTRKFNISEFLPAACQAIIAIECRIGSDAENVVRRISNEETMLCYETEKEVLKTLCADCSTPVSAYAELSRDKSQITLTASLKPQEVLTDTAPVSERFLLAQKIAKGLKNNE